MNISEIDKNIQDMFLKLDLELSVYEKKKVHFKSIRNFVFHLIENNKIKKGENKTLQRLGEERVKVLLLEYLKDINNNGYKTELTYKNTIQVIGAFMMKYYNFSYSGGKVIYLRLLFFVSIGALIDAFLYSVSGLLYYVFFISIIWFLISSILKYRNKKVFGYHY